MTQEMKHNEMKNKREERVKHIYWWAITKLIVSE